jgi:aryl-alcohol dehydrogenase-like predicted oxidoreductase
MFNADPAHRMLRRAVSDDLWQVIMVGFNIINQSARTSILKTAISAGIGVLDMFAVRLALSRIERLREVVTTLVDTEQLSVSELNAAGGDRNDPLGWVVEQSDTDTLVEAAYRFVRHEPGIDVTLSGTGNRYHLLDNIDAVQKPPLPPDVTTRLVELFRRVDSVTGQ